MNLTINKPGHEEHKTNIDMNMKITSEKYCIYKQDRT